ncbi:lipid II-degrading bacteriocin, partial [Burkholderia metallica]|uniref:lipid II-degrading bacteriocin n=1 Tax=Burkholderia metallica TaxID=488729 RepID=UPI001CF5602B
DGVNSGISGSSATHNSLLILRLAMPQTIRHSQLHVQVVLATLNPDKFDFDASRSRPSIQEALTTLVRKIGEFTDHKDFMIYFTGSQPLNVNGTRASIKAMNPDGTPAAVHTPRIGGFGRRS